MLKPSFPVRLLAGLCLAVSALTVTVLAMVAIDLLADAIEAHRLLISGG